MGVKKVKLSICGGALGPGDKLIENELPPASPWPPTSRQRHRS